MLNEWSGVFPYLPSPIDKEGKLDGVAFGRVVNRCLNAGVHGVTPLGSSGELPYLSLDQRAAVIEATVDICGGRVPVVAGVGGFDSASVARGARDAVAAGSDGVLLVMLAYFPLSKSEILRCIEAVVNAVEAPIVLYNHPDLTRVELTTEIVTEAHEKLGINYVKDASGRLNNIPIWREATGGGIRIFSATAVPPTAAMLQGACGWMSGPASVFPAESVEIYSLACQKNWQAAVSKEANLNAALNVFRSLGPGRGTKALLKAVGLDVGDPVAPLDPIKESEIMSIRADVQTLLEG